MVNGLPWWLSGKELTCQAGDLGSIPRSGICPAGGHGNPLQHSFLGNPTDRGAWWATVYGVTRVKHDLETNQQQNDQCTMFICYKDYIHIYIFGGGCLFFNLIILIGG